MDTTSTLATVLNGAGALLAMLLHSAQPTLDVFVPALLAYLAHRYVRNKTVAAMLIDMAGTAYTHMSAQFAAGPVNFGTARNAAIKAAVAGLSDASKIALSKMTDGDIAAGVNAKLGQLLASDPNFVVTDPLGKMAIQTAQQTTQAAVAAAVAAGIASAGQPASPEATSTPAAVPVLGGEAFLDQTPAPNPAAAMPNFDMAALIPLIQDTVRQGIDAAVHNGSLR